MKSTNRSILPLLWSFAFLSYLLRVNISVAQHDMAREFVLSDIQIGWVFSAFLVAYTIFQVPAGIFGDRWGARTVLTIAGIWWGMTTLLTGFVPGRLVNGSAAVIGSLLILRFLHGAGEAPTYPVAMDAVAEWFPASRHAVVNSIVFTGSTVGAALAPPLVANLMIAFDWRKTFYLTAVLPVIVAALWWIRSRGGGQQRRIAARDRAQWRNVWRVISERSVLFLCLSYLLYCYAISIFVYWLFKYLVDVRHLSVGSSGWAASIPWLAATIGVPVLGFVSTRLGQTRGLFKSRRLVATVCLIIASGLLAVGAGAHSIIVAMASIAVSVALLFSTESSYWSTAIELAEEDAGTASGLMNLAGNLGGVMSTILVPVIAVRVNWLIALVSGSVMALVAALIWFVIVPPAKDA